MKRDEWVRIGVIGRPHGVQGALKVHLDDPDSTTLKKDLVVSLAEKSGARERRVQRYAAGVLVLEDVADRDAADALKGAALLVRRQDFPVDKDAVYLVDVVGRAVRSAQGANLGAIRAFSDNGAQPLAHVQTASGEVLLPFVAPLVVAIHDDVVIVAPPPGLFDDGAAIAAAHAGDDAADSDDDADDVADDDAENAADDGPEG